MMTNTDPHNVCNEVTSQDTCTSSPQATSTPILCPVDIVRHDHSYCMPLLYPASTPLTPIIPTEPSVLLSFSIVHNSMQTNLACFPFRIEDIADNDNIIHFYTGFSNYHRLIMCYEFLSNFWTNNPVPNYC